MVKSFSICAKNLRVTTSAIQKDGERIDRNVVEEYIFKYKQFPCSLFLKKSTITRNGIVKSNDLSSVTNEWEDYQYGEFANIFSEALKNCLDEVRTEYDDYEWIPVEIVGSTETRTYYVPLFNSLPDVLDEKNTTYMKQGWILRPCFAVEKICKYSLYQTGRMFWRLPNLVDVNEAVKKHIRKRKFSNLMFEGTLCSKNGVC